MARQCDVGLVRCGGSRTSAQETKQNRRSIKELEREIRRKDKALAETAALLVLSKKVAAIFNRDMLGAVSAFELSMINERRAEGQAKAGAAGKHMGRHAKLSADQVATIRQRAADGESKTDLATEYGISRATLYAAIKVARPARGPPRLFFIR